MTSRSALAEGLQHDSRAMIRTTLLEVVNAVAEASNTESEVVAVLHHLFTTGRMRLVGEFTEKDFATFGF
jgi:hypothetical protein